MRAGKNSIYLDKETAAAVDDAKYAAARHGEALTMGELVRRGLAASSLKEQAAMLRSGQPSLDQQVASAISLLRSLPGIVSELQALRQPGTPQAADARMRGWAMDVAQAAGIPEDRCGDSMAVIPAITQLRANERALLEENTAQFHALRALRKAVGELREQAQAWSQTGSQEAALAVLTRLGGLPQSAVPALPLPGEQDEINEPDSGPAEQNDSPDQSPAGNEVTQP